MTPTEVLKMLKSKIDAAVLNKCNYAIETSDIEAINEALAVADVSGSLHIEKLMEEYKKEQMPDANTPFHHESEIASVFNHFILWVKRKNK